MPFTGYRLEGCVVDVYAGIPFWASDTDPATESISVTTWLIDQGEVGDVDISEASLITVTTKLGSNGSRRCRRLMLLDEEAPPEVVRWLVDAFEGRLGGPLAALAALSGDQIGFYQVPINYRLEESRSAVRVPGKLRVVADGRRIPESHPACSGPWLRNWIGRSSEATVRIPEFDMAFELQHPRAVRGRFRFVSEIPPSGGQAPC